MTEDNNIPNQDKVPDPKNLPRIVGGFHKYYLTFKDSTGRNYFILKDWAARVFPDGKVEELSNYEQVRKEFIEKLNDDKVPTIKAWSGKSSEPYFVNTEDIDPKSILFKNYNPEYPARYFPEFD